jgi:hypothetical protein
LLQITGAASVTAVGIGQRIEQLNSYDLAGQTCTLSVNIANSLLTTVTWTASYATTADTFGTIGTPTKTQISTGTFTVTSTLTQYTVNIAVPAAATTGVEILLTVGAQISGTWSVGNIQFEPGTIATPYDRQIYSDQLAQCQRYYSKSYDITTVPGTVTNNGSAWNYVSLTAAVGDIGVSIPLKVTMRTAPTVVWYSPDTGNSGVCGSQAGDKTANSQYVGSSSIAVYITASNNNGQVRAHYTAAAEL